MKVLGLVASPRNSGNSEILVKEMLASLPVEYEKRMIRLTDLDIKYCNACYACLPNGKNCVINDDLPFLLNEIKEADAVIIASACYFLGTHTSIKIINDRLISVMADSDIFAGKRCVTLVTYGIPGWEGYAREALNNFARFIHLNVVGDMLVQAASPGEAVEEDVLKRARLLADHLLSGESYRSGLDSVNVCQYCGSSLFQISVSGSVRCVMCGAQGAVSQIDGETAITFSELDQARYSAQGMDEHSRLLEDVKRRYISNRTELFRRRKPYGDYTWWVEKK